MVGSHLAQKVSRRGDGRWVHSEFLCMGCCPRVVDLGSWHRLIIGPTTACGFFAPPLLRLLLHFQNYVYNQQGCGCARARTPWSIMIIIVNCWPRTADIHASLRRCVALRCGCDCYCCSTLAHRTPTCLARCLHRHLDYDHARRLTAGPHPIPSHPIPSMPCAVESVSVRPSVRLSNILDTRSRPLPAQDAGACRCIPVAIV
ncbi:hypothetical protein IWX47DRAFT_146123 [Phyllosticta citricarpa]